MRARRRSDREGAALGHALTAARDAAGLRQVDVAAAGAVSQARLSRIERGEAVPSADDMAALLDLYRVRGGQRRELEQLAADARAGIRDQRLVVQRGHTSAMQARWAKIEREARLVRSYQPALVLGVLQIPAYAAVVLDVDRDDTLVQGRTDRHRRLLTKPAHRYVLVQTEGALRMTVGSAELMAEQVDALIEVSRLTNVRLGVIPARRPMSFTCGTAFHLYDDAAAAVGLEVAAARLTEPADVAHFAALFERLAATAVYDDEARRVLDVIATDYRALTS